MEKQAAYFQALMRVQTQQGVWFGGGPPPRYGARFRGHCERQQGLSTSAAWRNRHKDLTWNNAKRDFWHTW
eukprot:10566068-Prorocentrum_lima.AAC.1